jgi:Spy/CpxP family protein refolding chaperone
MKKTKILAMLAVLLVFSVSGMVMAAEDNDRPKRGRGQGGRGQGGPGMRQRGQGGPGGMMGAPGMGHPGMMGGGMGMFQRLGLSEEQRTQIAKIRAEAMRKMMADIKKILTDEQREKLEDAHKGEKGPKGKKDPADKKVATGKKDRGSDIYSKLDLSEEQSEAIAKIHKDARASMKDVKDKDARREMQKQVQKDISAILTDEQSEKLKELRKGQRKGGEGKGRGKGGRGRGKKKD